MPPHRNVPAPTPSMKPIKPERTLRSHEENQERAYIAASRRSDRSLEARVESARRASDIHKKRTGRALRVTEQDVMNEEMYEEEDDDIPWRYRSVTSHLPLEDGLLSRRIQSMLAVQLENQRLLGQAVNSTLQHNPQIQSDAQFISPGMMQMSQGGYPNSMLPPQQQFNRNNSYRHTPYPLPNGQQQQMSPSVHQRSASLASPQDMHRVQQHQQSGQSTPVPPSDDRRMSLPQSMMSQPSPSQYGRNLQTPNQEGSAPTTPSYFQKQSSPELKKQHQRNASYAGQYDQNVNQRRSEMNQAIAPLTTTLPMETQQILAGSDNYPNFDMLMQQSPDSMTKPQQQQQQPFYSYKPNPMASNTQTGGYGGLDQTLMPTQDNSAASVTSHDTPLSATSGSLNSAVTDPGYGFGFDGSMFGNFNAGGSGLNSGQASPGQYENFNEPLFNDFLEADMFGDYHAAASG